MQEPLFINTVKIGIAKWIILVMASGLFYYFEESKVLDLFKRVLSYDDIEVVFDTVNKRRWNMVYRCRSAPMHRWFPTWRKCLVRNRLGCIVWLVA